MALFKRRESRPPQGAPAASEFIGRRFESASPVAACLETYERILPQLYPVEGPAVAVDWSEPTIPAGWTSSQFTAQMPRPPDQVLGHPLRGGATVYLAVWDNGADSLTTLWFVPPDFDHTEVSAIGGTWFSALRAAGHKPVVSDGFVERTVWGVPG